MYSLDGITWVQESTPANTWQGLGVRENNNGTSTFIAVADGGTNRVMRSTDGVNWTSISLPSGGDSINWLGVDYSPSLDLWCAVGFTSGAIMTSSDDGLTWTLQTSGTTANLFSVAWSPTLNLFVTCGNGNGSVLTSSNGINWFGGFAPNNQFRQIKWSERLKLFVMTGATGNERIFYSVDGIHFIVARAPFYNGTIWGVGFNNDPSTPERCIIGGNNTIIESIPAF
jgi:hypothetical protein